MVGITGCFSVAQYYIYKFGIIFLLCYIQILVRADIQPSTTSSRDTGVSRSLSTSEPDSQLHRGSSDNKKDNKALWLVISSLKDQVKQLEVDRQYDRTVFKELERQMIENQEDTLGAVADIAILKHSFTDVQNRLTQVEENVDNYRLNMEKIELSQNQIKTELNVYKKLKDNTRRSFRKMDRNIGKYHLRVENLENEIKNVSFNLEVVKSECLTEAKLNQEKLQNLEGLIENRTNSFLGEKFRRLRTRLSQLYNNISLPSGTVQLPLNDEASFGSGEMEADYVLTPVQDSSNRVDTGSGGDDELREIPIGVLPHSHRNYLKIEDFFLEIQERDDEITELENMYDDMKFSVERVEERLASIQLGDFMGKLQESLLNFTQNVITLDQWKMASTDIVNSTQLNQQQINSLTNMILNNTNHLRELEWKITDVQSLGYQQFNLLRMYVIQLNNSMQDMKEAMTRWQKRPSHTQPQHAPPHNNPVHYDRPPNQKLETLLSRIEDLALQIIYNENRISKLEIKAMNESLFECKKYSTDMYQDSKITQVELDIRKLIETGIIVKEMVTRLDRGLFKVHLTNKNQSDIISRAIREISFLERNLGVLTQIKHEVDHMTLMLPKDCDEYYHHGYKESGVYVIYPINTNQSLKVRCDMEDNVGGWTIIQRRFNGSVDFNHPWNFYKYGFGDSETEYWLGNDIIHSLTTYKNYSLKIEMVDVNDKFWTASYDKFSIGAESTTYRLFIEGYHGNSTNAMDYSNGMGFSTPDQDNDGSSTHCAMYYTSGWWYKHCHYSNLNGRYRLGMVWYNYDQEEWIQLKETTMKIKPFVGL